MADDEGVGERTTDHPTSIVQGRVTMVNRFLFFILLGFLLLQLTGCSSGGGSASNPAASTAATTTSMSLTADELTAVESSLIATRLAAVQSVTNVSANVLADVTAVSAVAAIDAAIPGPASAPFEFMAHGRRFHGRRDGADWLFGPPDGGGPIRLAPPATPPWDLASPPARPWDMIGTQPCRMWVASEACTVVKTESGGVRITRADGRTVEIGAAVNGVSTGTVTVNGVDWTFTWGTDVLLTLQNTRNGRTLQVIEDTAGNLTITPVGGPPHRGRWHPEGMLAGNFPADGQPFRFRGGRFE